ncbi:MAG: GNAT family N-acetyltransferase [Cyanobacteria bacterium SID2]|nr:GNAT family N-acetyltransferase [Cyanobacteria bacterium SID2]MBP0006375.1 GNAT family N-acetyltransferase [Cyanobacteria bacterium SBC]
MKIYDLDRSNAIYIQATIELLVEGFQNWPSAYSTEAASKEVLESLEANRLSRVAVSASGEVLGWIGGIPSYDDRVWEIHPLVVRSDVRRRGIGQALVADLEILAQNRGGLTLWVGTDDECGQTSLSNVDLYPDVWTHVWQIRNLNRHPYEFYQKQGFVIVGVMPDANGRGKPDIYMAKRIERESSR